MYEYGIQSCQADYCIFVCYAAGQLAIFKPSAAVDAIPLGTYKTSTTYQGYAVPMDGIKGLTTLDVPPDLLSQYALETYDTTAERGKKAQDIVYEMSLRDLIALPLRPVIVTDAETQRQGKDLQLAASVEVKCDKRGGEKSRGGTGNLFIQTAEANPAGIH